MNQNCHVRAPRHQVAMRRIAAGVVVLLTAAVAYANADVPFAAAPYPTSFEQVRRVVFDTRAQPVSPASANATTTAQIQQERAVYASGRLPQYRVSADQFVVAGVNRLRQDAERTLHDRSDLSERMPKLLHANGVCVTGIWQIDQPSVYTGAFKQGTHALLMGRASVSLSETRRGQPRGFAFAGKLFATLNPNQPVPTANFFVADVLAGTQRDHYMQVSMSNQPELGFRWAALPIMFGVGRAFAGVDRQATYRPVYNVAALGHQGVVRAPKFMLLRPAAINRLNNDIDFRDELSLNQRHAQPWGFEIWVSDQATQPDWHDLPKWQRLGDIQVDHSVVSYGCDRQLHFAHPTFAPQP